MHTLSLLNVVEICLVLYLMKYNADETEVCEYQITRPFLVPRANCIEKELCF